MRNTKLLQKKLERRDVFIAMMSERMGKATEWTIVIDGLPIENGDFPWQTVSHNQMVYLSIFRRDVAKPRKAVLTLTNQKDGYEIL